MSQAATAKAEDFPDRLPPMLIKELRQGMRAKGFVGIFLGLQVFLVLLLLATGAAAGSDRAGSAISTVIFFTFSLAVLLIQPLRGLTAVSSEIQANTLDMIVLTRLSAWRIVLGKWSSIVIQSALLLVTIFPYLILRYFFGGMNLIGEIVALGMIFATSIGLTAATVGLSASSSKLLRGLVLLCGALFGFQLLFVGIGFGFRGGGAFGLFSFGRFDSEAWTAIAIYLAVCMYLGYSMLSLGASLIAPAAENHAALRRVIALAGLIAVGVATAVMRPDPNVTMAMLMMVAAPAIVIALSERLRLVPTNLVPFFKRGIAGRAASILFCPGWAAGVNFTAAVALLSMLVLAGSAALGQTPDVEGTIFLLSSLGTLLLAGGIISLMIRHEGERLATFVLLVIALILTAFCVWGISEAQSASSILWLFLWNPFAWWMLAESQHASEEAIATLSAALNLLLFAVLILRALSWNRSQRDVFREARRIAAEGEPNAAQT